MTTAKNYFQDHEFHPNNPEPSAEVWPSLYNIRENILNPLREAINIPITITSGDRSQKYNIAVGGAPKSQHMACKLYAAVDFVIRTDIFTPEIIKCAKNIDLSIPLEKCNAMYLAGLIIQYTLPFDQLIFEGTKDIVDKKTGIIIIVGSKYKPRWIHVSLRTDNKNRKQVLFL